MNLLLTDRNSEEQIIVNSTKYCYIKPTSIGAMIIFETYNIEVKETREEIQEMLNPYISKNCTACYEPSTRDNPIVYDVTTFVGDRKRTCKRCRHLQREERKRNKSLKASEV